MRQKWVSPAPLWTEPDIPKGNLDPHHSLLPRIHWMKIGYDSWEMAGPVGVSAVDSSISVILQVRHERVRGFVQKIHSAPLHIWIGYFYSVTFICEINVITTTLWKQDSLIHLLID